MPQRDPGVYPEDIEHHAAAAVRFTSGFSLERFLTDEKTRAAVERGLEVCGEAMTNLCRRPPLRKRFLTPATSSGSATFSRTAMRIWITKVYNIAIARAPQLPLAVQDALKVNTDSSPS
jgi:hypothetical protein